MNEATERINENLEFRKKKFKTIEKNQTPFI
jgi:hypothetical protein